MACSCKCCCGCCCDGETGEQKLERQCTSPKEFQGKGTSCDVCCDLGEIREDIDSEEDCPGTWVVNGRCQDEPCDPCATCDPAAVDCYYAYYQMCYKDEFGGPDGGCGDCAPDVVLRVPCGLSAQARLDWWSANAPHTDSCYAQTYQLLNRYCCDGVCQSEPCPPPLCSGPCDNENPCTADCCVCVNGECVPIPDTFYCCEPGLEFPSNSWSQDDEDDGTAALLRAVCSDQGGSVIRRSSCLPEDGVCSGNPLP